MDGRAALLAVLALSVALAGCEGTPCPPGETAIAEVPSGGEDVAVGGSISEFTSSRIVVDDGTGRALLVSLDGYDTSVAGVGDCIVARGDVVSGGTGADGGAFTDDGTNVSAEESGAYDVVIRTTSVELRQ
jgi:hypothetical protein